jgi:NTE family protein
MPRPVPLSLALQGGGAHGAFTWGVLDALLDEPRIAIDAVAGCSAGAMNAVAMAQGWMENGRAGARHALQRFWGAVADSQPAVLSQVSADGLQAEPSALLRMMLLWARPLSPREANPFGVDPLREIVAAQVDFAALRQRCPWPLAIATTQALSGRLRVFQAHEISADVLLASACLPRWHHPVQVQGEPHWDGGYAANPPLWPLLECSRGADWLLVPLLPLSRRCTPSCARCCACSSVCRAAGGCWTRCCAGCAGCAFTWSTASRRWRAGSRLAAGGRPPLPAGAARTGAVRGPRLAARQRQRHRPARDR